MPAGTTTYFLVTAAAAVTILGAASSCGQDNPSDNLPPPPASPPAAPDPSPSSDLSPDEQQAVGEAQAKFDQFMNAYVEVSTASIPTPDEAEELFRQVDRHVAPGVLSQELRSEIIGRWGAGQVARGTLTWEVGSPIEVDLDRKLDDTDFPTVYVDYCIDATDWRTVNAENGEPSGARGGRDLWSVGIAWSADWSGLGRGPEGWRIAERDVARDHAC